ncbi:phosphopantetheine-binding protein [Streptomyces platensis subsp. clarensis]|uniref:acyl carrier protein n=1 Tax=unclassified Streptomyces TaxID=2593676 RepID=UPI00143E2CC3|nr:MULTISPECIES: acyl carrier protein [unclassified Streptomyces]MCW7986980.1 phosphopantetheine-binding protein [Streptomyces platensis subsp. clarensis]QIY53556.1 acyl carrier protein [Streptomyces sp. RPA4-5]WJY36083.1 acyl carrier protein [Streptomyces sp. P9-2B-2]
MNRDEALNVVRDAIEEVIPGADLSTLRPDSTFRDTVEMDSLDFLSFVEILSGRTGIRIDDEDTPRLTTLDGCTRFLVERTQGVPL